MQDERFCTLSARTAHIDALYRELAACVQSRSTAQWLQACERLDIPAAPLRRLADLESDEHLRESGFFISLQDPKMGTLRMPDAPLKFDGAGARPTLPPRLGQHTVEVLQAAGLPADTIAHLLKTGAAVQNNAMETPS
jgi:crotonobetainyl-CoA:carnitine CoA-transferase CaiB-like acyl-CoA transferase